MAANVKSKLPIIWIIFQLHGNVKNRRWYHSVFNLMVFKKFLGLPYTLDIFIFRILGDVHIYTIFRHTLAAGPRLYTRIFQYLVDTDELRPGSHKYYC